MEKMKAEFNKRVEEQTEELAKTNSREQIEQYKKSVQQATVLEVFSLMCCLTTDDKEEAFKHFGIPFEPAIPGWPR